ncbi:hypothetical protein MF672_023915 [Actinomadura sp. ATCC 31491]|uniref:Cytochrome d ubiquinol oxidase subunit II n=1 Tax=Actinomadura luzonensis TaxID=2805427 RepID=A0ABT0FWT4_9ACTN|nr:hypothetical protein [Actinomadura luzonensis]MCK2216816.1 hypothetical protein [Actinomadura luzonensis]
MVAGLLLPPLTLAGLWYGVGEFARQTRTFQVPWTAAAVLAATAIVLALLAGSRISPVASLIGGLVITALGVLPLVEIMGGPQLVPQSLLPAQLRDGYLTLGYSGLTLFLGAALLVVSLFPSRWRAAAEPPAVSAAYGQGTSPYLPEDATRPMYRD